MIVIKKNSLKKIIVSTKVSHDVSPIDESPSEPLTELLGESGDINQADSYGRTVLHTLAADGNASLLELALAACPQVHFCINAIFLFNRAIIIL